MKYFSERNGIIKSSDALIINQITAEMRIAIYNCYTNTIVPANFGRINVYIQREVCARFLNRSTYNFRNGGFEDVISPYLHEDFHEWNKYYDLVEFIIETYNSLGGGRDLLCFIKELNKDFERLNYGYRIINNLVTPITSIAEIESIEETIDSVRDNIREHLKSAIKLLSEKENPDYRNSIKESISAVGALCREMTGENDLGKALFSLEKKQGTLHPQLKAAFCNLYNYVNEKRSGIRHELMDETGTYVPSYHEAKFMLVSCSAFINYMNGKFATTK